MSEDKDLSNSEFQLKIEELIIDKIREHGNLSITSEDLMSGAHNIEFKDTETSFQVDFYDIESKIIGEIYTCGTKLLSGHKRKIAMDALKLITIERMLSKDFKKYIILAMPSLDFDLHEDQYETLLHPDEFEQKDIIGRNSWLYKSFDTNNIELYYFFLDKTNSQTLQKIRNLQKEGMKK